MKVRIFQKHTHEGVDYAAGSEIDLPDADAQWLLDQQGQLRAEKVEEAERAQAFLDDLQHAVDEA